MPGMMSIGGIASGLKTDEIISKIMEYARQPQTKMQADKAEASKRLTVWQDLNTRVLALRLKADAVADAADFQSMNVSSSNEDILTASASTGAAPGSYFIKVISRAQSHQIASQAGGFTSVNDIVGTGDVTITMADSTSIKVTLDASNDTLSGLRDAINKANQGVKATIINSGTSASPDYRLVLTSTKSGTANAMTAVNTAGLSGGTAPTFDLLNPVQAAADAVLEIGEGLGKITVTKDSNTITDLIPGLTLNVASYDASQTIRLDVTRNTQAIRTAIEAFVSQYNDLADAIGTQFDYDTETGESGTLMGDYQLQAVQMEIEAALTGTVVGLTGEYTSLSELGITQDPTGHLVIDDAQLSDALDTYPEDVARLFDAGLDTSSSYISFIGASSDTKPSGTAGWSVEITQAARRAQVTAGVDFVGTLDADERLTINGTAVELDSGMDIDAVVAEINKASSKTGVMALKTGADGTDEGNYITFRRTQYGSSYSITVVSDRSLSSGVTTGVGISAITPSVPEGESGAGQGMPGLDVAGTINGEAATGNGQMLSLNSKTSTNAAKGLSILCTATGPMAATKVIYTRGIGAALRDLLSNMTSTTGAITTAQNGINDQISDLDKSIADMETRLADQEARLYNQFNSMEAQLAKLQSQGNYLASQFAAMNKSK